MFLVEQVHLIQKEQHLCILESRESKSLKDFIAIILYDARFHSYNVYLISIKHFNYIAFSSLELLASNCFIQPLEIAQFEFPEYNLNSDNYGFSLYDNF